MSERTQIARQEIRQGTIEPYDTRISLDTADMLVNSLEAAEATIERQEQEIAELEYKAAGFEGSFNGAVKELEALRNQDEFARSVATEFYYWWHNQPDSNTQQGWEEFWRLNRVRFLATPPEESK